MPEAKRMAEEAYKVGQEAQEQAERVGREFQTAAEGGLEAATRSIGEMNKGLQAIAIEMSCRLGSSSFVPAISEK